MKMSKALYEEIKSGIKSVVEYVGPEEIKATYASLTPTRMAWDLFHIVSDNKRYDDTHPRYKKVERILPFVSHDWSPYNDGLNDDHIHTALMRIVKELGLTS